MFEASHPFVFFDYFRVPYRVVGAPAAWSDGLGERHPLRSFAQLRANAESDERRALYWPLFEGRAANGPPGAHRGTYFLGSIRIHGSLVPDTSTAAWLRELGTWRQATAIRDANGAHVASIWRDADGNTFLPFEPCQAIRSFWSEAYRAIGRDGLGRLLEQHAARAYYRLRPLVPRASQIWLRRRLSRLQARTTFPSWPIETALHDLYELLFRTAVALARMPIPWLAPWPAGRSWALVLTHDVETQVGYRNIATLRRIEETTGMRSSWNLVPLRYPVSDALVRELRKKGFEVGVHGLYHDGRDFESFATFTARLDAIKGYARRWDAVGFRSPSTHRVWDWMPLLAFDYDSSYPDTDPFEPWPGGCCSWLPYFNQELVELPITLPQDHTLFVILRHSSETAWVEKTEYLKARGGMALLLTHPDYLTNSHTLGMYRRFLTRFRNDPDVWSVLPREVSSWWRRRAASEIRRERGGWRVVGPAEHEAVIRFAQ